MALEIFFFFFSFFFVSREFDVCVVCVCIRTWTCVRHDYHSHASGRPLPRQTAATHTQGPRTFSSRLRGTWLVVILRFLFLFAQKEEEEKKKQTLRFLVSQIFISQIKNIPRAGYCDKKKEKKNYCERSKGLWPLEFILLPKPEIGRV